MMIPLGILGSSYVTLAGGGSLDVAFASSDYGIPTESSTDTRTAMAIGDPATDRTIVALVCRKSNANGEVTSVTIGGVSATIDYKTTGNYAHLAIAHAAVPTGTTADVVTVLNTSGQTAFVALYRVTGGTLAAADGDANTTNSATVTVPTGGFSLFGSTSITPNPPSFSTNITEDLSVAVLGFEFIAGNNTTTGDVTGTTDASADVYRGIIAAAYGPA